jgi:hypothetical protein
MSDDKLPAYQWYPGDWLKDPNVRLLTLEEKGAWRELLDYMWGADERGKMASNGQPWPISRIARLLSIEEPKANQIITTLIELNVASKDPETGIIFSRRQVRFKDLQEIRRENGKKGGRPPKKESENLDESQKKTKQSPSSSASTEESAAAALSATSEATPRSPENGRENQSRKPEPEPEPEPKRIWPEEFHCDPEFWLEKLAEHADADKQVESAAMAAGLGYEDAILMQINFCSLKRKDEMTTPKMARAIADRCRSMIDSPRCQAERLEVVS